MALFYGSKNCLIRNNSGPLSLPAGGVVGASGASDCDADFAWRRLQWQVR